MEMIRNFLTKNKDAMIATTVVCGVLTFLFGGAALEGTYLKEFKSTSIDRVRTYSEEVAMCHTFQRYWNKEITEAELLHNIGFNLKHHGLHRIELSFLKDKYSDKKLEERKIKAMKNWLLNYIEHYKKFDEGVYKRQMGYTGISFETLKSYLYNSERLKLDGILSQHNPSSSIFTDSTSLNVDTIHEINIEEQMTKWEDRLIKKPRITKAGQILFNL